MRLWVGADRTLHWALSKFKVYQFEFGKYSEISQTYVGGHGSLDPTVGQGDTELYGDDRQTSGH
jgi:hypothetical protein